MKKIKVDCDKAEVTFTEVLGFSEEAILALCDELGSAGEDELAEIEDAFEINHADIIDELQDLRQRCR